MSKSTKGLRNAGLASLAITLTLGAGALGAGAANAVEDFKFDRIAGVDRFDTAKRVSVEFKSLQAFDEVILVNGQRGQYADALAAAYLAGDRQIPILLTKHNATPEFTLEALEANGVKKITIVGGEGVVSAEQEDALAEDYTVTRIEGIDRYKTNAEVLKAAGATTSNTALVAAGNNFADALAGSPLAYKGSPLGLAKVDDIDDDVKKAIVDSGVKKVVILGGPTIVGPEVEAELKAAGLTVERVHGADRSETSMELADYAIKNLGVTDEAANVASGSSTLYGADALAGGPLTGEENRPMLITMNIDKPGELESWFEAHANTLKEGIIFGGNGAVSTRVQELLEEAASKVTTPASATTRPELVSASIVETITPTQATTAKPAGTYVRYNFDERVLTNQAATTHFKVYRSSGESLLGSSASIESGGMSVLVRFTNLDNDPSNDPSVSPADLTVATVVAGAVTDAQGETSPAGDAAIGTSLAPGGGTALPAGVTAAPDLVSVGNFRESSTGGTTVDFTFDEAAYTQDVAGAGFALIPVNGATPIQGVGPLPADSTPATGTVAGGNGTTTIRVTFAGLAWNTSPSANDYARGVVGQGAVRDSAKTAASGNENPLQAADMSNGGNTTDPDLVSVAFRPDAMSGSTKIDQVVYTFDQTITSASATLTNFVLYEADGDELTTATAVAGFSGRQVVVDFPNDTLIGVVGGSVRPNAVEGPAGSPNEADEVGQAGTAGATEGRTPGATEGPDLTDVTIGTAPADIFGNPGQTTITFTFDEDVTTVDSAGAFTVYEADGDAVVLTGGARGTTEATDNTVTFTAGSSTVSSQWKAVVLGTVAADAVQGQDDADNSTSNAAGAENDEMNPEGAEFTTGGTGTPAA